MARFFLQKDQVDKDEVLISGEDAHHISRVLRLREGNVIECVWEVGLVHFVEITGVKKEEVAGKILRTVKTDQESPLQLTLWQSLAKGDKMDFVVQKAVELGVREIIPYVSRYTVVQLKPSQEKMRRRRWNRIAKAAAQQCERTYLPQVGETQTFPQVLANVEQRSGQGDLVLVPYEGETEKGIGDLPSQPPQSAAVLIGPEGGFHREEIEALSEKGALPVSLGPRVLRTETAGLVALSLLGYKWGDLG
ncbi:MAG: 16S rRNA (uracil(1498)-N(3))-methyltransferase [Firmicutes bacterium]|nr:16S rRNA (uracil(1498)-N(3))-methyltransferase [Bacillota bacterium]